MTLKKKKRFPHGYFKGKLGLQRAKEEIFKFKKTYNRIPTKKDVPAGLVAATYRGYWAFENINNWNDFLDFCGLEVNLDWGKWKGKNGFEKAKNWIRFYRNQ